MAGAERELVRRRIAVHRHRLRPRPGLEADPLSDVAGLVARGEAIGGEEAERLEAELRTGTTGVAERTTSGQHEEPVG
ncbi:hypothetical protein ACWDKQ_16935 [Saccharopolyspora sp. NPDC000995]